MPQSEYNNSVSHNLVYSSYMNISIRTTTGVKLRQAALPLAIEVRNTEREKGEHYKLLDTCTSTCK